MGIEGGPYCILRNSLRRTVKNGQGRDEEISQSTLFFYPSRDIEMTPGQVAVYIPHLCIFNRKY
jgi:hypothetical protein